MPVTINTNKLQILKARENYKKSSQTNTNKIETKQHDNDQQRWNEAVEVILQTVETLGTKERLNRNHGRIYDNEIKGISEEQKQLRVQITLCKEAEKHEKLEHQRNRILKSSKQKVIENRDKEIDDIVRDVENLHEESKIFKAVRMLNRTSYENPFIYDKEGKCISNPREIYKAVKTLFKQHFFDESVEKVPVFVGETKKLDNPITTNEVGHAVNNLNNNGAAGPDRLTAELVKYAAEELDIFIKELLNHLIKERLSLDLGSGIL
eukprot:gene269-9917_t